MGAGLNAWSVNPDVNLALTNFRFLSKHILNTVHFYV